MVKALSVGDIMRLGEGKVYGVTVKLERERENQI